MMLVAIHERDQDEDHLASVHVSEQTQGKRDWLRQEVDTLEQQIGRHAPLAERLQRQLAEKAADALHLEAVVENQE